MTAVFSQPKHVVFPRARQLAQTQKENQSSPFLDASRERYKYHITSNFEDLREYASVIKSRIERPTIIRRCALRVRREVPPKCNVDTYDEVGWFQRIQA